MTIGERIKLKREELGMSQEELAEKIGYKSRSSINKIELDRQQLTQKKIKVIAEKIVPLMQKWMDRDCEFLICNSSGTRMSYYVFRDNYWKGIMDMLSMERRPHDTRHTCITMLTEAGVDPRIIRQIVGHKGQGVTEAVYTHVDLPAKLEAINRI